MQPNFMEQMVAKYPLTFANKCCRYSACGKGWERLLERLFAGLQEYLQRTPEMAQVFMVTDIKEKYGTLRFYYNGGDDVVEALGDEAEFWSKRTCEVCGAPGILVMSVCWVSTRCPDCKKEDEKWTRKLSDWVTTDGADDDT